MSQASLRAPIRLSAVLAVGCAVELDKQALTALRFREINTKEAFTVLDGKGNYFRAALTSSEPGAGRAQIYEAMSSSPESPLHLTLLCSVLARQRMLGVIQKATELGVMAVVPVLSERSVQKAGLAHEKAHAWPAQALRAARQCRRASIPQIHSAVSLEEALRADHFQQSQRRYYLDDRAPLGSVLSRADQASERVAFVVGPEGGFTDSERELLIGHRAQPLRLGARVLRAETSALVGVALLQHHFGDL